MASGSIDFFTNSYGAFVGYSFLVMVVTCISVCVLKEMCRKYYGREICPGASSHNRRSRRENGNNNVGRDEQLAIQMQQQLDEEERGRARLQRQKARREKYEAILAGVTVSVKEEDLRKPRNDIEACIDREAIGGNERHYDIEEELMLNLSIKTTNETDTRGGEIIEEKRLVSGHCAICIGEYHPGDLVVYSTNYNKCRHVFHKDCILTWLSKGKRRCPCCRRFFVAGESKSLSGGSGNPTTAETSLPTPSSDEEGNPEDRHEGEEGPGVPSFHDAQSHDSSAYNTADEEEYSGDVIVELDADDEIGSHPVQD